MWIINGVEAGTRRVRQQSDLSYWMSDWEISTALNIGAQPDDGLWPANAEIESFIRARRGISSLRSNIDEKFGALYFVVEHRGDWESLLAATWSDDKAESPSDPQAAARAHGRDSMWCAEGFDLDRRFMVEEFELSHRISEHEIIAALGNPPEPYFGGLPPTEELLELMSARINLDLRIEDVEYQINLSSRYGSYFPLQVSGGAGLARRCRRAGGVI
ncbi:MAG TPA: hypothetical protein VIL16_05210 [Trebonia sp.]